MSGSSNESLGSAYVEVGANLQPMRNQFAQALQDAERVHDRIKSIFAGTRGSTGGSKPMALFDLAGTLKQFETFRGQISSKPIQIKVAFDFSDQIKNLKASLSEGIREAVLAGLNQGVKVGAGGGSGGSSASPSTSGGSSVTTVVSATTTNVPSAPRKKRTPIADPSLAKHRAFVSHTSGGAFDVVEKPLSKRPQAETTQTLRELVQSQSGEFTSAELKKVREEAGALKLNKAIKELEAEGSLEVVESARGKRVGKYRSATPAAAAIIEPSYKIGDSLGNVSTVADKAAAGLGELEKQTKIRTKSEIDGDSKGGRRRGFGAFGAIAGSLGVPIATAYIANLAMKLTADIAESFDTSGHPERVARAFEKPGAYFNRQLVDSQSQIIANAQANQQRLEAVESVPLLGNLFKLFTVGARGELKDTEETAKGNIALDEYNHQQEILHQMREADSKNDTLGKVKISENEELANKRATVDAKQAEVEKLIWNKRGTTPDLEAMKIPGNEGEVRRQQTYEEVLADHPELQARLNEVKEARAALAPAVADANANISKTRGIVAATQGAAWGNVTSTQLEIGALGILRRGGSREDALKLQQQAESGRVHREADIRMAAAGTNPGDIKLASLTNLAAEQKLFDEQRKAMEGLRREESVRAGANMAQGAAYVLQSGRNPFAANMLMQRESNAAELQSPEYRNANAFGKMAVQFRQYEGLQATTIEHFRSLGGDLISLEAERASAEDRALHKPLSADAIHVAANAALALRSADIEHFPAVKAATLANIKAAREEINPIMGGGVATDASRVQVAGDPLGLSGRARDINEALGTLGKAQDDTMNTKGADALLPALQQVNGWLSVIAGKVGAYLPGR